MKRLLGLAGLLVALSASARAGNYLFVWGMETRDPSKAMPAPETMGRDFLAVFDVRSSSSRDFGKLIAMLPVGAKAHMAHHTNYEMPGDGRLFASDYMSGKGYVFDLENPGSPKLLSDFSAAGPYTHAHSFVRLPNGNTLATYQFKGQPDVAAGALVELDPTGKLVRASDASDATDSFIRPYSLVAVPALDRVVTTSAPMMATDKASHVIQVWRLSDLKLLKSVVLPRPARFADAVAKNAAEPRLLEDGKTVLVVTSGCGLYRVTDLKGANPNAQFVYDFGYRSCGVPTVAGRYWIQTAMSGHSLISVDIGDLPRVKEAGRLALGDDELPHWVSKEPGENRIVITGFGSLATYALFAKVDPKSGTLTLERRRIDFDRLWPDGWNGPAMPHGALFSR